MNDIKIENNLCIFIKGFGEDLCSLELLMFFSRHPNARFNRTAVLKALTGRLFDTEAALKELVDKKLVVTSTENGLILYALTREEPFHSLAAQLINIDQRQGQMILENILDASEI